MLNLVGKNLRFSSFITTSVHRLFPRSSYSSLAAAVDNPFAVSYLIDSCGFPPDKAISASKQLKFKTSRRPDSVIAFFKHQGFTETQISNLVQKSPSLLQCHPEKNLLPKFHFLSSIGLSVADVCKLLTAKPYLLGRNLKNHIEPTFDLLRGLLQSNETTLSVIRRCPWVLDADIHEKMIQNMQILKDVGVRGSNIYFLLTYYPRDLFATTDQFKGTVDEVMEMGFDPLKSSFMLAVHVIRSMSKSVWDKKMETYEKWGWSKPQILVASRNHPWCMKKSEEKVNKVMDYLVNKMGFEASVVAKNSILVSYSLEKRIIPRYLVYQFCLDKGLIKDRNYFGFTLTSWLKCSESMLIKRLGRYEKKAPGVLKFYQEKLYHVN